MWPFTTSIEHKRQRALNHIPTGPMHDYLTTPFPAKNRLLFDTEIIAVDLETTGLDPVSNTILSIGTVTINRLCIELASSWHQLIKVEHDIPESSAVIHQITDDQAARGIHINAAFPLLLQRLQGKVMLVHSASVEQNFLNRISQQLYNTPLIIPMIDTQALAHRQYLRRDQPIKEGDLRLFNLRERFQLPRYKAHNALSDALATAELFLAMAADICPATQCKLKYFLLP